MTAAFVALASALICAAGYRLRGSVLWSRWTGRGVGTARIVAWGGSCALAAALAALHAGDLSADWWLPPAVLAASYGASTLPQWGSIDAGRRDGVRWRDVLLQSLRGAIGGAAVAAPMWLAGEAWWILPVAGAMAGPIYDGAWTLDVKTSHAELDEPAEWGELILGAVMGLAIAAAIFI